MEKLAAFLWFQRALSRKWKAKENQACEKETQAVEGNPGSGRRRRKLTSWDKDMLEVKEEKGGERVEERGGGFGEEARDGTGWGRCKEPKPKSPNLNTILQYFAILILPLLPSHILPALRILPFSSYHQLLFLSRARGHISFLLLVPSRADIGLPCDPLASSYPSRPPSEQEAHPCLRKCRCSRTARPLYLLESSCCLPP